jgi:exosome complex component RRP40
MRGRALVTMALAHLGPEAAGRYWVEHSQKRYIPQLDEPVVGVITARMGDNLEVDINAPSRAILPMLAFEGATRRNRPNAKARHLTSVFTLSPHREGLW